MNGAASSSTPTAARGQRLSPGSSASNSSDKKDRVNDVLRRKAEADRIIAQRRAALIAEQNERMRKIESQRDSERRKRAQEQAAKELRKQKEALDRRQAYLDALQSKRETILARAHAVASRTSNNKDRPAFAFGSRTPRDLTFYESVPRDQRQYDKKLTPTVGPAPPSPKASTPPKSSSSRRSTPMSAMTSSMYVPRTSPSKQTITTPSRQATVSARESAMTQSMYVARPTAASARTTTSKKAPSLPRPGKPTNAPQPSMPSRRTAAARASPLASKPLPLKKPKEEPKMPEVPTNELLSLEIPHNDKSVLAEQTDKVVPQEAAELTAVSPPVPAVGQELEREHQNPFEQLDAVLQQEEMQMTNHTAAVASPISVANPTFAANNPFADLLGEPQQPEKPAEDAMVMSLHDELAGLDFDGTASAFEGAQPAELDYSSMLTTIPETAAELKPNSADQQQPLVAVEETLLNPPKEPTSAASAHIEANEALELPANNVPSPTAQEKTFATQEDETSAPAEQPQHDAESQSSAIQEEVHSAPAPEAEPQLTEQTAEIRETHQESAKTETRRQNSPPISNGRHSPGQSSGDEEVANTTSAAKASSGVRPPTPEERRAELAALQEKEEKERQERRARLAAVLARTRKTDAPEAGDAPASTLTSTSSGSGLSALERIAAISGSERINKILQNSASSSALNSSSSMTTSISDGAIPGQVHDHIAV